MRRLALIAACAAAPFALADRVHAEEVEATIVEELVVAGPVVYRDRVEGPAPVLSYDTEYFQRFEPLSTGDALRRVPSVTFLSDVLESDGVRLRGLDPGYTQILINGERVPGGADDRSFFVDRIPAELIERVEIVRSASANRSGDAMAGALNIVLRDSYSLDGGYLRAGAMMFHDDEIKPLLGGVFGRQVGPGRLLVGGSFQGRYNPKVKLSQRFDEPGGDLDNIELQTDTRDGEDYSFNASYDVELGASRLELSGFFVRTNRLEDEDSVEYAGGVINDASLLTINDNNNDIRTDNWSLGAKYSAPMFGGELRVKLNYAAFDDHQEEVEEEFEFDPFPAIDDFGGEFVVSDLEDRELSARLEQTFDLAFGALEFGVHMTGKERGSLLREAEISDPGEGYVLPASGARTRIEETRLDPYAMVSGRQGRLRWEAGLRYENTTTEIVTEDGRGERDFSVLLPSAHLRFDLTENDRLNVSLARTVRRPNFNYLSPVLLEEELGDNDFVGNPDLEPETAWGLDIGFERRLGRQGIVGVNAFYRDVSNLIEIANTGEEGSEGAGTFLLTPRNTGDGKVWGVEFDLSTPLTAIGLSNTGVFFNYSWLDSEITDFLGKRRFNDQSDYVFNVGFIHDLPRWGAAFGATYRQQGDAYGRMVAEEVRTSYGADLEVFVEKRFGENLVVRLTGSNLLDARKEEVFDKFDSLADQAARDYDEYELEAEEAGPVFRLVARMAF